MTKPKLRLGQIRSRLRKHLAQGWQRAVFRAPRLQRDEQATLEEEVLQGPGSGQASRDAIDELLAAMQRAGLEGKFKQIIVLGPTHRLEIDARHGSLKQRKQDEAALHKMMGSKDRTLRPDKSQALLRELGLLNADGTMSRRHARKYKQVDHFVQLCRPILSNLYSKDRPLQILDLACGNSYLGFVLLEALALDHVPASLLGVDRHAPWIEASRERAQRLPHLRAQFECAQIQDLPAALGSSLPAPDLMVALHACDTASDQAIDLALKLRVPAFLCAPCCHAQAASQLQQAPPLGGIQALHDQGLLRRGLGEVLTDALRVDWIRGHGYEVSLLEFVASEHSAKNLLIRAQRKGPVQLEQCDKLRAMAKDLGLGLDLFDQLPQPRRS